jgi:hypothetical protein
MASGKSGTTASGKSGTTSPELVAQWPPEYAGKPGFIPSAQLAMGSVCSLIFYIFRIGNEDL